MWPDLINEGASLLLKFDFLISFNLIVQLTFVTNLFGYYDIETNLVRSSQGSNSQNIYATLTGEITILPLCEIKCNFQNKMFTHRFKIYYIYNHLKALK